MIWHMHKVVPGRSMAASSLTIPRPCVFIEGYTRTTVIQVVLGLYYIGNTCKYCIKNTVQGWNLVSQVIFSVINTYKYNKLRNHWHKVHLSFLLIWYTLLLGNKLHSFHKYFQYLHKGYSKKIISFTGPNDFFTVPNLFWTW